MWHHINYSHGSLDIRKHHIELLSPARTADSGRIAINYGADAVYIGAPLFSARAAAGNRVQDIEKLADYAHRYHARVYVALNTILFEEELVKAHSLIWDLYQAGADALIIQDMAVAEMDLPPVELHASTQANNFDVSKVRFLESAGFSRVVLARELTLSQIREMRKATSIELECFVHGALCVSLSGRCYMSLAQGGRSGNRGVCAQPCRKLYDLVDARGKSIAQKKHLLSLKDLDLSDHLSELIWSGVNSLKIEGRLKDDNYVKNITAHYRKLLDSFLQDNPAYGKASSGNCYFDFEPDPSKTFSRGSSYYFLNGRTNDLVNFNTPKSAGEFIGTVIRSQGRMLELKTIESLNNNDGLCYFDADGNLAGLKVNVADGNRLTLAGEEKLSPGTKIFRNYDHKFSEMLKSSRTRRKIDIRLTVIESNQGLLVRGRDEDGVVHEREYVVEKVPARNAVRAEEILKEQMGRSGDSIFRVIETDVVWADPFFLPVSLINRVRREFLDEFIGIRIQKRYAGKKIKHNPGAQFPVTQVDFTENISNSLSRQFYERHGVVSAAPALEVTEDYAGKRLMTMKHCLKYQLGYCRRYGGSDQVPWEEPLFLVDGDRRFRLEFECTACRMNLYHM